MQKSKSKITFVLLISLSIILLSIQTASARVGVGVNLGKIKIDEPLKPGGIYGFPSIGVINTGDEPGEYEIEITYHQDQPELKPDQDWFLFSPPSFHLEPGESRSVAIKLVLPVKMKPGDYFAYIEAHPVTKTGAGTTIGVAAATKVYFNAAPANVWQAIYWRVISFFTIYAPWTYVALAVVVGAAFIALLKKYFTFQIGMRRKM